MNEQTTTTDTRASASATTDHAMREAYKAREAERQEHAGRLVEREVMLCVSTIVHGLVRSEGACREMGVDVEDVYDVCRRDDWQAAAEEEGWEWDGDAGVFAHTSGNYFPESGNMEPDTDDWRELCEVHDINPHDVEAYEHWAVSDWLGQRLEAAGEMVAFDFAGMPAVWGRTCTGQAIALDGVVQRIAMEAYGS